MPQHRQSRISFLPLLSSSPVEHPGHSFQTSRIMAYDSPPLSAKRKRDTEESAMELEESPESRESAGIWTKAVSDRNALTDVPFKNLLTPAASSQGPFFESTTVTVATRETENIARPMYSGMFSQSSTTALTSLRRSRRQVSDSDSSDSDDLELTGNLEPSGSLDSQEMAEETGDHDSSASDDSSIRIRGPRNVSSDQVEPSRTEAPDDSELQHISTRPARVAEIESESPRRARNPGRGLRARRKPTKRSLLSDEDPDLDSSFEKILETPPRVTRQSVLKKATTPRSTPSANARKPIRASRRDEISRGTNEDDEIGYATEDSDSEMPFVESSKLRHGARIDPDFGFSRNQGASVATDTGKDIAIDGTLILQQKISQPTSSRSLRIGTIGDEDDIVPRARRLHRSGREDVVKRAKESAVNLVSSEDEDIGPAIPTKRRRLAQAAASEMYEQPLRSVDEKEELRMDLEDLEDLQDASLAQSTPSKRNTARKDLELLKARRANHLAARSSPNLDPSDQEAEDSTSSQLIPDPYDDDAAAALLPRENPENLDAYESDFVTDDETIGVPSADLSAMPLEFTRHAHKRPKEHFNDVVAWMVHRRIDPEFATDDPIYQLAFRKIDDEARTYAGSRFASAAWKSDFLRALQARPLLGEVRVDDAFLGRSCEACGRQGHTATWMLRFYGRPYDKYSLEEVWQAEDDVDEEEQDHEEKEKYEVDVHVDSRGEKLPSESTEFFLGKHCRANATTAHALTHWRHHLDARVADSLATTSCHLLDPSTIASRARQTARRRADAARNAVEALVANGEIAAMWRDFRNGMEAVRERMG